MSSYYKQRILSNIQQQVAQQKNNAERDERTINEAGYGVGGGDGNGDGNRDMSRGNISDEERDDDTIQISVRNVVASAPMASQIPSMRTAVNRVSEIYEPPPPISYMTVMPASMMYPYNYPSSPTPTPFTTQIHSVPPPPPPPPAPPAPTVITPPMPPASPSLIPSHVTSSGGPPPLMATSSNTIPNQEYTTQQFLASSQSAQMLPQVQTYFVPTQIQTQSQGPAQAQAQAQSQAQSQPQQQPYSQSQARRALPSMVNRAKQSAMASVGGGGGGNGGGAPNVGTSLGPTSNTNTLTTIEWNQALEQLLITWAEKANGHAWLHSRCINHYKQKSLWITIPAAVFGYLAGTTTLLGGESLNRQEWFRGIVGISAIVAGILSNLQQTFTYKELSEQHRIASLRFFAFFRDVSAELSLEYKHRANVLDYITLKRMELDKLYEQSPTIPQIIIDEFNDKFKNARYHKPDVALTLQTIVPYSKIITKINNETRFKEQMQTQSHTKNNETDDAPTSLSDRIEREKHRELLKEAFKRWRWFYLQNRQTRAETMEKEHGVLVEVANSDAGSLIHAPRGAGAMCAADRNPQKRINKTPSISLFWGGGKKQEPRLDETMRIPLKPLLKSPIPKPKMAPTRSLVSKPLGSMPNIPTLSKMMRSKTEQNRERDRDREQEREQNPSRDSDDVRPSRIKPVRSYNSLPNVSNRQRGSLHDVGKEEGRDQNISTSYYTYGSGSGGESGSGRQPQSANDTKDKERKRENIPTNKREDITQRLPPPHQSSPHRHHHRRHRQQNTVISNTVEIAGADDTLPKELGIDLSLDAARSKLI